METKITFHGFWRRARRSWSVYLVVALVLFSIPKLLSSSLTDPFYQSFNIWFGADIPRILSNMVSPCANHYRTSVHPLFSLLTLAVTRPLLELGVSPRLAVAVVIAASAPLTGGLMLSTLQRIGLKLVDAALMVAVFASTAGFMFWWSVPETFPLGSLTIILPFWLLASGATNAKAWVITSAASLSITTTNWLSGLISTFLGHKPRKAITISLLAFLLVFGLSIVQRIYVPTATFFWRPFSVKSESSYMSIALNRIPARTIDFFVHPAIAPDSSFVVDNKTISFLDASNLKPSALIGVRAVAAGVWGILLLAGLIALLRRGTNSGKTNTPFSAISIFLASQYFMHMIYGDSPFLYSAHFIPVMVMFIGFSLGDQNPPWSRQIARVLMLLFIIIAFPMNIQSFQNAIQVVNGIAAH